MATAKEALLKVEAHERECAIRYENIEKRLDEGSAKFRRLEYIMWGLYGLTAASLGIDKLI
jgi:hypothetical protein|tara:strand:- start:1102 stop:1284 length:183 start_codon:yes stop_codon:yes gene_type:complete